MADKDAEVREAAQTVQLTCLTEYAEKRAKMSAGERAAALAEIQALVRPVEASAKGAAYPFLSPSSMVSSDGLKGLGDAQATAAPR